MYGIYYKTLTVLVRACVDKRNNLKLLVNCNNTFEKDVCLYHTVDDIFLSKKVINILTYQVQNCLLRE